MKNHALSAFARVRQGVKLSLLITAVVLPALGSVQETWATAPDNPVPSRVDERDSIEKTWGVRIQGIWLSAGGYMLDFRYRVMDPEKAAPLFARKTKPYLIDQASDAKFMVPNPPKVGPLRNSDNPKADRTYFIIFSNPGKYVKAGNKVTVVIGDFKAGNLIVQ